MNIVEKILFKHETVEKGPRQQRGEEGVSYLHLCQELQEEWEEEGEEPRMGWKEGVSTCPEAHVLPFRPCHTNFPPTRGCVYAQARIFVCPQRE